MSFFSLKELLVDIKGVFGWKKNIFSWSFVKCVFDPSKIVFLKYEQSYSKIHF